VTAHPERLQAGMVLGLAGRDESVEVHDHLAQG
jgi:hypothetical protein